jgi:hypothetical protein
MTTDRALQRLLDRWLEDGPIEVADRVIDNIADRIDRVPQRPAWRASRRFDPMTSPLKLALAAAIVVAVGLSTVYLLSPSGPDVGGRPANSPSASPSPPPSRSPSPTVQCEDDLAGCAGPLAAGEHQSSQFDPTFTFTTPDGWRNVIDQGPIYKLDPPSGYPYLLLWSDASIALQDASCSATPDPTKGRKAADWIETLTTHPGLVASPPVNIDLGGRSAGQQVELALDPDWTETCPQHDGPYVSFLSQPMRGEASEYGLGRTERVLVAVVDIGQRTVVILSYGPVDAASFATSTQAVRAIIASSHFTCGIAVGPCGSP